jgi:glycosyltransferase involved in cell wall biosynthesis
MDAPRQPLSAVVITLNCAAQLAECLDSLDFADEIVVVDSGSTDGTAELAQARGARLVQHDWMGFGAQKQFGTEQASHDWVLSIDSDERVTPELRESILAAMAGPEFKAYQFPRSNRFMGRYLRHGEGYPDWSLRLFDRRHARWSDDEVHERVLTLGPVESLQGDLLHDSAQSLEAYLAKQNRYSSLAAQTLFREGRTASVGRLLFSPVVRFLKFYLLRRGFLDGVPGFLHIAIGCFNSFTKYMKLLDLEARGRP